MKFSFIFIIQAILLFIGYSDGQLLNRFSRRCVCHLQFKPVCTRDNLTFANACNALCRQKSVACHSRCPCPNESTKDDEDEDGSDSYEDSNSKQRNFSNEQQSDQEDEDYPERNDFRDDCSCSDDYEPVCGRNGETFRNKCKAKCEGEKISCNKACPCKSSPVDERYALSKCTCELNFKPVCGVNGVTYSNACYAKCRDVRIDCNGRCPCRNRDRRRN